MKEIKLQIPPRQIHRVILLYLPEYISGYLVQEGYVSATYLLYHRSKMNQLSKLPVTWDWVAKGALSIQDVLSLASI